MRKCILLIFLISCQTSEADFPELLTKDAQQIGARSAVLEAEVTEVGPVRPIEYGFLWSLQPDITIASAENKVVIGLTSDPKEFSIKLDNLVPSTEYYFRSFAADPGFTKIYYGAIVKFVTLP